MKKEYYLYIIGFLLLIAGVIYYNRPLPAMGLMDPGESYFTLPHRTLPSSWEMANGEYDYNNTYSEENKKLYDLDKIFGDDHHKKTYMYSEINTGNDVVSMNRKSINELFNSGDNRDIIQYHIDNLSSYISGYELYPPRLDFSTAIPRLSGVQGIYRVGSIYSASLCHEGKIVECTENFKTLFNFSQQMKNSSTLISLLIGIVEEDITMDYMTYLYTLDPVNYRPLITMLQSQDYLKANNALRYAFMSEYHLFKNAIYDLPSETVQAYDMVNIVSGGGDKRDPTELLLTLARILRLPPKRLFDVTETITVGRSIYYNIITSAVSPQRENIELDIATYRTSGHPVLRKNILGYTFFNALIPRLTGMKERVRDSEQRYTTFIQQ